MTEQMRYFSNETLAELNDGYWTVITTITQRISDGDAEPQEKKISTKSIDRELENAFKTAITSLERTFDSLHKDLFDPRNVEEE